MVGFLYVVLIAEATFSGIWADSWAAPSHRNFAVQVLLLFAAVLECIGVGYDVVMHDLTIADLGDVTGVLLGSYLVWQFLWRSRLPRALGPA
jgi:hypothetical protein